MEEKVKNAPTTHNLTLEFNAIAITSFFDEIKAQQTSVVLTDYKIDESEYEKIADAYFYVNDSLFQRTLFKRSSKKFIDSAIMDTNEC